MSLIVLSKRKQQELPALIRYVEHLKLAVWQFADAVVYRPASVQDRVVKSNRRGESTAVGLLHTWRCRLMDFASRPPPEDPKR